MCKYGRRKKRFIEVDITTFNFEEESYDAVISSEVLHLVSSDETLEFPHCHIGMNRLAIVDRNNAKQPISSKDNRYHIVFNGEIYN